ncbi:hypothetical protein DPMN_081583 [Dreissena polymorpha]|uniref:Uncharacterized protein n=2 Tax=Dreissena polymorpha TaxID=45954 RepID=A0A9D3Y9A1_DREPO|nr:hypothetical protein DPMN_081583 [Dreissena polymorpha]
MENDTPAHNVGTLQASGQRRSDCSTQPLVEDTELKNKQPVVDECKSMDADSCMVNSDETSTMNRGNCMMKDHITDGDT